MRQKLSWDTVSCLQCPDCATPCVVRLVLLSSDGRIVYVTACAYCADHASIRCFKDVSQRTFMEARANGLPVIRYASTG